MTVESKPTLGVGMVGHAFMGATHSQAWRNAPSFFDLPLVPRLAVLGGRDRDHVTAAAARLGWQDVETDWRVLIERGDVGLVDIAPRRHTPRSLSRRSLPASMCCARSRWPTPSKRPRR